MRPRLPLWFLALFAAGLAVCPASTSAQIVARHLAFRSTLGWEDVRGSLGTVLKPAVRVEWTMMGELPGPGKLETRVGLGLSRVTYESRGASRPASDTNAHADRWHHLRWHVLLGVVVPDALPAIDVYAEARHMRGRLRSQTELRWPITADPPRDRPFRHWRVKGFEGVLGLKTDFGTGWNWELDLHARLGQLRPRSPGPFDLTDYGLRTHSGGAPLGIQIGVLWNP